MQEATDHLTLASEAEGLNAAALHAEAWAGEPFLHPEEDPGIVLDAAQQPGGARVVRTIVEVHDGDCK